MDMVAAGTADLSLWQFLALGAVAFFGAVLGGVSGFGAGLIVTPFLVPVVGIKGVVPVMSVAMVLGNLSRFWVYRDQVRRDVILKIMIPAVPGVIVGTLLYDVLPREPLALCIGAFLLVSIPLRRHLAKKAVVPTPAAVVGVSAGFGVVSGALPGGGIVLMPLLLGLGLSTGALVGTDAIIGMAVNLVKIAMFGKLDLLNRDLMIGGLLVGLCMIPGAYGARWLIERMNVHLHTAVIEGLVVFSGLSFIWSGLFP
jgi:uncharacterized membrane protein YfcA